MKFDWTINIGNLIPIVAFLSTIVYKMTRMETKVETMWTIFIKNNERRGRERY